MTFGKEKDSDEITINVEDASFAHTTLMEKIYQNNNYLRVFNMLHYQNFFNMRVEVEIWNRFTKENVRLVGLSKMITNLEFPPPQIVN